MTTVTGLEHTLSVLTAVASERTEKRMIAAAGESFVNDTLAYIEAGKSFRPKTGTLQRSIGLQQKGSGVIVAATAKYAGYVEFGSSPYARKNKRRPYPFLIADIENRQGNITDSVLSVLATVANGG